MHIAFLVTGTSTEGAHHLCAAKVQGFLEVRLCDAKDSLHAVINEGEAAGLLAVTPHLNLVSGSENLAAEGRRGLLASALPGSVRTVDVVEAGNPDIDAEVRPVVLAQLLGGQLLQTVGVLRLWWYTQEMG